MGEEGTRGKKVCWESVCCIIEKYMFNYSMNNLGGGVIYDTTVHSSDRSSEGRWLRYQIGEKNKKNKLFPH